MTWFRLKPTAWIGHYQQQLCDRLHQSGEAYAQAQGDDQPNNWCVRLRGTAVPRSAVRHARLPWSPRTYYQLLTTTVSYALTVSRDDGPA